MRRVEITQGEVCRFRLAPRFTVHLRHRQKHLNVRLAERDAFVFTRDGAATGEQAWTLGELVTIVGACAGETLDGHLRRGDFSRWIASVGCSTCVTRLPRRSPSAMSFPRTRPSPAV